MATLRMPVTHKIAVVDDDDSVRQATGRLIESFGYEAEDFPSAREFLQSPRPFDPACLILDVHMRGMDGLQLQRQLMTAGCQIPIIFITAYPDEATRGRTLQAGAIDFLHKPFSEQALFNSLTLALNSRKECDNLSQSTAKPARLIGGRLEIDSTIHGTNVRVTIPMGRNEREKTSHSDC